MTDLSNDWPRPITDDWRSFAACRGMDPNLFFPTAGELHQDAVRACEVCPVAAACLEDAMGGNYRFDGFGYRAGTTEAQRYNVKRRLRRAQGRNA